MEGLTGRQWDKWEPLLAIGDEVGGGWGEKAREAARALSGGKAESSGSVKTLLLRDLKTLFGTTGSESLSSKFICHSLAELEERPWSTFGQERQPITDGALAGMLRGYGVRSSGTIRPAYQSDIDFLDQTAKAKGEEFKGTAKGYKCKDLQDAFERYTPEDDPDAEDPAKKPRDRCEDAATPFPDVTTSQPNGDKDFSDNSTRHEGNGVMAEKIHSGHGPNGCDDVTDKKGVEGQVEMQIEQESEIERYARMDRERAERDRLMGRGYDFEKK